MKWEMRETPKFEKEFGKLPSDIQKRFKKQFFQVAADPFSIGKPLGYTWLRELKNEKFRVYYVVFENRVTILFVGASDKKNQQQIINTIKSTKGLYSNFVDSSKKNLLKEEASLSYKMDVELKGLKEENKLLMKKFLGELASIDRSMKNERKRKN